MINYYEMDKTIFVLYVICRNETFWILFSNHIKNIIFSDWKSETKDCYSTEVLLIRKGIEP